MILHNNIPDEVCRHWGRLADIIDSLALTSCAEKVRFQNRSLLWQLPHASSIELAYAKKSLNLLFMTWSTYIHITGMDDIGLHIHRDPFWHQTFIYFNIQIRTFQQIHPRKFVLFHYYNLFYSLAKYQNNFNQDKN